MIGDQFIVSDTEGERYGEIKGCAPDEQMLQLLLVTHINREQMATQVARERERESDHDRETIT